MRCLCEGILDEQSDKIGGDQIRESEGSSSRKVRAKPARRGRQAGSKTAFRRCSRKSSTPRQKRQNYHQERRNWRAGKSDAAALLAWFPPSLLRSNSNRERGICTTTESCSSEQQ
ncbi:hypothetical protein EJ06DRAFT_11869 [Trichodelitschia bisporula]|uniref:Uncharacterized protein n=1 Tax=Trichodelitschia bisporula TaxID=703511 RepID=A0A6G1IAE5_9PEZI|nr:hypothetical protein EJ06DRAFT_11869 [Trichodelitschia bisporula]